MKRHAPAGAPGDAGWQRSPTGAGEGRPSALLLWPDAANAELVASGHPAVYYYLPEGPLVARDSAGEPVVSLTLVLSRSPRAAEDTIRPLIDRGVLTLDLTVGLAPELLAVPPGLEAAELRPLFARQATFGLVGPEGSVGEWVGPFTGSGARGGLSVSLGRADTLEVLEALDGVPSRLSARARVSYRLVVADQPVFLTGSWARIHDFLYARLDPSGRSTARELRLRFAEMLAAGVVTVSGLRPGAAWTSTSPGEPAPLFEAFMGVSSVILRRETSEREAGDPDNQYSLRGRPHELFQLDLRQTIVGADRGDVDVGTPLAQLLGGLLTGRDRTRFIHLVAPTGGVDGGGGMAPAPRRVRTGRTGSRRTPSPGEAGAVTELAAWRGAVRSVALALRPGAAAIRPHVLAASDLAAPAKAPIGPVKQWLIDDLVIERPTGAGTLSLPVIDDPAAAVWRDRARPARRWYAPAFDLVSPAPSQDPTSAPFLFTFRRTGVTADGRPALEGTVRLTLRPRMSPEAQAALAAQGNPEAQALPTGNLSASLGVPFVDEAGGAPRVHELAGTVEHAGDQVTVTVRMLNDWVRLCYGALAQPGFQPVPARLRLAYSHQAYVPIRVEDVRLTLGPMVARTAIVYSVADRPQVVSEPVVDATHGDVLLASGEIRLRRETPRTEAVGEGPDLAPTAVGSRGGTLTAAAPRVGAVAAAVARPRPEVTALARPTLKPAANLADLVNRTRYAVQTLVREERGDAFFDCRTLGAFYRETSEQGSTAIGCDDALQLGRTRYRQYESMPELSHPLYSVYRSLQQPGRFLVLPAAYRITRYDPSMPAQAYRPVVHVYASVDPATPANNRVVVHAVLQADIPPHLRRDLLARLAAFAQTPVIEYPTEIDCEPEYAWVVGGGSVLRVELRASRMPDSFQVTLTTDPTGLRLLLDMLRTSGVSGSVRFRLPDGTALQSSLAMELRHITGPWRTGPIEVTVTAARAALTNRIERPVAVSDLVLYGAAGGVVVPVEVTLAPGATCAVTLPVAATEAYAAHTIPAGDPITIEEIRSFVEDVQTNVIFISLVNFANHGLRELEVEARIEGESGTYRVAISGDPPVGTVDIILPLTTYLARRILQFRVTKTFATGPSELTPWIDWDLGALGNVVSLQWEMIA